MKHAIDGPANRLLSRLAKSVSDRADEAIVVTHCDHPRVIRGQHTCKQGCLSLMKFRFIAGRRLDRPFFWCPNSAGIQQSVEQDGGQLTDDLAKGSLFLSLFYDCYRSKEILMRFNFSVSSIFALGSRSIQFTLQRALSLEPSLSSGTTFALSLLGFIRWIQSKITIRKELSSLTSLIKKKQFGSDYRLLCALLITNVQFDQAFNL